MKRRGCAVLRRRRYGRIHHLLHHQGQAAIDGIVDERWVRWVYCPGARLCGRAWGRPRNKNVRSFGVNE